MKRATMRRVRRRTVALVLPLLLVAAGCGSDGDDSDASAPTDEQGSTPEAEASTSGGCAVLSVDEVTAAVGEDITGSTELPAGCQWTVGGAEGAWYDWQSFPAEVYIENRDNAADFGLEVETVDGLGDEAFRRLTVSPEGDELNGETWVLVGETGFQVRVSLMGWSEDLEVDQRALAELIAARL